MPGALVPIKISVPRPAHTEAAKDLAALHAGPGAQNGSKTVPRSVVKGGPERFETSFGNEFGDIPPIQLDCIFTIPNTFQALEQVCFG